MTKALDAATAACRIVLEIHHKRTAEDFARAALRAALPAEPEPLLWAALLKAVNYGDQAPGDIAERAYRALRAHLLGEDA